MAMPGDPLSRPLTEIARDLRKKRTSARELVEAAIARHARFGENACTPIRFGRRTMGHALDVDDTLDTGGSIHPGVSVLGAALAVCDQVGGATGKDFLSAVALGLDVSCRIALASTVDRGWHRTAAMGAFGAAAAAGKLSRLSPEQMLAAFGIAYSHAAGNRQCIIDGALTKRMQAGQAATPDLRPRQFHLDPAVRPQSRRRQPAPSYPVRQRAAPARRLSAPAVNSKTSATRCWSRCFPLVKDIRLLGLSLSSLAAPELGLARRVSLLP
jgi:hypothetical protein